jgi:rhodanese-related sulfurtransferase
VVVFGNNCGVFQRSVFYLSEKGSLHLSSRRVFKNIIIKEDIPITKTSLKKFALLLIIILGAGILSGCNSTGLVLEQDLDVESPPEIINSVTVDQAYQLYQDGTAFLDVRTSEEWEQVHIPGATLLPLNELEFRLNELPRDLDLVVYCRSGNRSLQASKILLDAGFTGIINMQGGINDWINSGYEVDTGN